MKFKEGDLVEDSWYPEAGIGIVKKILKTRIKVFFERASIGVDCPLFRYSCEDGILTYDKPHYKFLKKRI